MGNDTTRKGQREPKPPKPPKGPTKLQMERSAKLAEIPGLHERAKALVARMPAEYQDWGTVRTEAYLITLASLRAGVTSLENELAKPKTKPLRFNKLLATRIEKLERMATCDIETCNWATRKPSERAAFNVEV